MELADDLNNGAYVIGAANPSWQRVRYAEQAIALRWHDGAKTTEIATGDGRPILDGDPVAAVVLLANLAALAPRGLCAGDIVTTGSCTGAVALPGAGEFEADFGSLGRVRMRVS
jgi:2-keto-4-pentenoate hydratase